MMFGKILVALSMLGIAGATSEGVDTAALAVPVTAGSAYAIVGAIQQANSKSTSAPIYLFINSPGGEVMAGGLIVDAIEASRRPVYTVCISFCASMAAWIHQAGAKRFMFKRSVLMFHNASLGAMGNVNVAGSEVRSLEKIIRPYNEQLAKRARITYEDVRAKENDEWYLDSEEAQKYRLSDGTVDNSVIKIPITEPKG